MTAYKAYPTVKSQPNRKARKAARNKIFWENYTRKRRKQEQ